LEFDMKRSILCLVLLAVGADVQAAWRVDDPPPEPVECPMCGGNANVHARRLVVIQEHTDRVALLVTRW
jgi:hypothetical protein